MPPEHELNDEEWRTLFPDAPPRTRLNPRSIADPQPADRELTNGFASRRLPAELLAACDALGTHFADAWRRTGDVSVTIERAEAEWLRWGEFLWTLGADESVAVIDPLACTPASTQRHSPPLDSSPLDSSPLDSSQLDSSQLDSSQLDSSQLDSSPLDSSPLDSPPLDSSPLDSPPLDSPPLDSPQLAPSPPGSKSPPRPSLPWQLTLHTRLLRSFWEHSLGGGDLPAAAASPVAEAGVDRPLTAIERRLARKALRPLVTLWLGAVGVAPPADAVRDGGRTAASTNGTEERLGEFAVVDATPRGPDSVEDRWVAMICFRVESGASSGRLRCVLPAEWTAAWLAARLAPLPVPPTRPGHNPSSSAQPATVARDAVRERWTVELAEQSLPADALEDLRIGDLLRSDHPLDYPLLARAESGAGVIPVRIGVVDGEPVARRVDG